MKSYSVYPLWAWCTVHGWKRLENRDRRPPGAVMRPEALLAIQASVTGGEPDDYRWVEKNFPQAMPPNGYLPAGVVLGVTRLLGVARIVERKSTSRRPVELLSVEYVVPGFTERQVADLVTSEAQRSWAEGPVVWVLDEPVALPEPVPCRGMPGVYELPVDVEREVLAMYDPDPRARVAARERLLHWKASPEALAEARE